MDSDRTMETNYQPRYLAYCRAMNCPPEEMWQRDGNNGGKFIWWIRLAWDCWKKETGYTSKILTEEAHKAFDLWLTEP